MLVIILLFIFLTCNLTTTAQVVTSHTVAVESADIAVDTTATATVREWFRKLEEKGFILSYNSSDINLNETVKISRQIFHINDFLSEVLHNYIFETYFIPGNKILIQIKGGKVFLLRGKITDSETNQGLDGCSIFLKDEQHKTFISHSDAEGYFKIKLPKGRYTVSLSYIGYKHHKVLLDLKSNLYREIHMTQTALPIREVIVNPSPLQDKINYKGSQNRLSLNNNDPFAQIKALPGIAGSAVSGELHVNGGQSDENQILIDGIPLFHSHHNNALLSQFNGDIVSKISFYDSFIPAQYEGRLSSVTDVKIRKGDHLKHNQILDIGMPSAALTFDGPIIKDKFTYLLSGRHSWLDFMKELVSDKPILNRTFYDLTGKIYYKYSKSVFMQALFYKSNDLYRDTINTYKNQKLLEWKSSLYSLSINTHISDKISNTSTLAYTDYTNSIFPPVIELSHPSFIKESIRNLILKSDFSTRLDTYVKLTYGMKISQQRFNLLTPRDSVKYITQWVGKYSSYLNANVRITDNLNGSVSINCVSYIPKNHRHFFSLQPRITLRYVPNNSNMLSFDFTRMEQFYHNICLGEIPIPNDLRIPSINGFKPSSSLHCEVGWKHSKHNWIFLVSSFYKRRFNILGVRYRINTDEEEWKKFIMNGNAQSYGIKFHSLLNLNKWLWDFSYTYSRSYEWFKEYNANSKSATLHDIPHILNCAVSYNITKKSFLTVGGYLKSGSKDNIYNKNANSNLIIIGRKNNNPNYKIDCNFGSSKLINKRMYVSYKLGIHNLIGNPKDNEYIGVYTVRTKKNCLPYFSLKFSF